GTSIPMEVTLTNATAEPVFLQTDSVGVLGGSFRITDRSGTFARQRLIYRDLGAGGPVHIDPGLRLSPGQSLVLHYDIALIYHTEKLDAGKLKIEFLHHGKVVADCSVTAAQYNLQDK